MDLKSLIHTDALSDKSLWLSILVPMGVMLSNVLGHPLDSATVMTLVSGLVAFIVSSKAKQTIVAKEAIKSGAADDAIKLLDPSGKGPA